jgi:hypothetical protein
MAVSWSRVRDITLLVIAQIMAILVIYEVARAINAALH